MGDLEVHQLVHNFHIFVVPMVSPEAVFAQKEMVTAFGKDYLEDEEKMAQHQHPSEKLVKMDFGVLNNRQFDRQNPHCFETNGAYFLAQLMQRHIFTVVLDLADGTENQIIYPYGFEYYLQTDTEKSLLEQLEKDKLKASPGDSTKPKNRILEETKTTGASEGNEDAKNKAEGTVEGANEGNQNKPENGTANEGSQTEPKNPADAPTAASDGAKNESQNDQKDDASSSQNGGPSSSEKEEQINMLIDQIYDAYHLRGSPNEINFFKSVAMALLELAGESKTMPAFKQGMSRTMSGQRQGLTHVFNMFIDFAYAASFNSNDINLTCTTSKSNKIFKDANVTDQSYRALAFSLIFKKNTEQIKSLDFWGEQESVKFRLYKNRRKSFNIWNSYQIGLSKKHFGKAIEDKKAVINTFEEGVYGTASRFNVLFHRLTEILQPRLTLNSIALDSGAQLEYYEPENDEDRFTSSKRYIKSTKGHLQMGFIAKGCNQNFKIYSISGDVLKIEKFEYSESTNETYIDLLLPFHLLQNPFDRESTESSPSPANPDAMVQGSDSRQKDFRFFETTDDGSHNLLATKLVLECGMGPEMDSKVNQFYPESHFGRTFVDPGYFGINMRSGKIEAKARNSLFQITIQDISQLEQRQLIRQTIYSSIEVVSDFDFYFNTSEMKSFQNLENLRQKKNDVKFEVGDTNTQSSLDPNGPLKFFTFDENKFKLRFHKNLKQIATYWDLEFTSFADIGCCTTGTLGKVTIQIRNKSRPYDEPEASWAGAAPKNHRMVFGKRASSP